MKNNEIEYSLNKFKNALDRLSEVMAIKDSSIAVDAAIQRFEFTFELAWKTLKRVLYQEGIVAQTPREVLKEGFKLGYIRDEQLWLKMLSDRNNMSHTYNEEQAKDVYNTIPDYIIVLQSLYKKIENTEQV